MAKKKPDIDYSKPLADLAEDPALVKIALQHASLEQLKTAATALLPAADNGDKDAGARHSLILYEAETRLGQAIVPESAAIIPRTDDALMGQQLTEQYRVATGAMQEVIKFGAMMMMLRAHLSKSTRGLGPARGRHSDGGIDAWLKKNAPEVKKGTAYRFMHVAEAVQQDFRLPAKIDFIAMATTPEEKLPDALRKKQLELWEFASGRSRNSWLDRFAPAKKLGGSKHAKCPHCDGNLKSKDQAICPHCKKPTGAEPEEDTPEKAAIDLFKPLIADMQHLMIDEPVWSMLPAPMLIELDRITIEFRKIRNQAN